MTDTPRSRCARLIGWVLLACLFAAAPLLTPSALAQDPPNRRVALVVGNGSYLAAGRLNTRLDDARAVAKMLRDDLGFTVRLATDVTRSAFLTELATFARAAEGAEIAIFYYVGHAAVTGGENYLLPIDARLPHERHLPDRAVALSHVMVRASPARIRVVLIDACTANPVTEGMERFDPVEPPPQGMAGVPTPPRGTLVSLSTTPGTASASDCNDDRHPFTKALLDYLPSLDDDVRTMLGKVVNAASMATRLLTTKQRPVVVGSLPEPAPVPRPSPTTTAAQQAGSTPPVPQTQSTSSPPATSSPAPATPSPSLPSLPSVTVGVSPPQLPAASLPLVLPTFPVPPLPPGPSASQGTSGAQAPQAPPDQAPPPPSPAASTPTASQQATPTPAAPPLPARPRTSGGYACPEPGTVVSSMVGRDRFVTIYQGADPADPSLCLARTDDGQTVRRPYNFFDVPLPDDWFLRQFDDLLAGRRESISRTRRVTMVEPLGSKSYHRPGHLRERWDRLAPATIRIDGQPRPAIVVQRTLQGVFDSFYANMRYWIDAETGLWLKSEPTVASLIQTRMIVTEIGRR